MAGWRPPTAEEEWRYVSRRSGGPLDPLGFRYGHQRMYFPESSHKTLEQNKNPNFFLGLKCKSKDLLVRNWGGDILWVNGTPVGGDLLSTSHHLSSYEASRWSTAWLSPIAPIVTKCTCGRDPCLERLPLQLVDPTDIRIYDWDSILTQVSMMGITVVENLPTVFGIVYQGTTLT